MLRRSCDVRMSVMMKKFGGGVNKFGRNKNKLYICRGKHKMNVL